MARTRTLLALALLAALPGRGLEAQDGAERTIYLELWKPHAGGEAVPGEGEALEPEETPGMRLAIGRPTVAAPIAGWCEQLRREEGSRLLPEILLRDAEYERFGTESVPLLIEILIDDVELRYALGTERPRGATGLEFPFFELCALGFGRRGGAGWAVDVVHLGNHRGDRIALGVYQGELPASERSYLEAQLGHPAGLPDPAGILLLGRGRSLDALLLAESADGAAFEALRRSIVR